MSYWQNSVIMQNKITNGVSFMKHKNKSEIKLGRDESFTEDLYNNSEAGKCPECGGILVTNYGDGISCTFCVDCDYNEYDYD